MQLDVEHGEQIRGVDAGTPAVGFEDVELGEDCDAGC